MTQDAHSTRRDAPAQDSCPAEPAWGLIAERVDALAAAWEEVSDESGALPSLPDFALNVEASQLRPVLIELVKVDLEHRWQRGSQRLALEEYLEALPQLGSLEQLPVDLIYEELQARLQAGESIYEADLRERFPAQAVELCELLGGMAISGSPTCTYFAATQEGSDVKLTPPGNQQPFGQLQAGEQLDDFQLLTPLGSGAFARVFLARQISMERLVALKISMHAGSEPQTLAQLDHPNVIRVFDQRECHSPPAQLLYMEVAPGGTLYEVLKRLVRPDSRDSRTPAAGEALLDSVNQALRNLGMSKPGASSRRQYLANAPWHEVVCRLGSELAEGLAYAHSRGVLHRDIKPANVLLTAECEPKLADFNVSYNGGRADENPGDAFGGSLAYMSPEQLEACHPLLGGSPQQVRETSDIYATGVMLWELLCGRRPFRDAQVAGEGGQLLRLQRMIELRRNLDATDLAEQLPADCPRPLKQTLLRCLQPEKQDRFQSAGELARALKLCLDPHGWQLLEPPATKLGRFVLRHPILTTVLAGLLPNVCAGAFNYVYNRLRMLDEWPSLYARFDQVQLLINCIAFPLGVAIGAWAAMKTLRLVRQKSPAEANLGARRVLRFGHFISLLLLTLWTLSGIAFPLAIDWGAAATPPLGFHLHFFTSLALCGVAATAYPYFLITALATHFFVPTLVRNKVITGPQREDLKRTAKLNRFYLAIAGLAPMLGVLVVVAFGNRQDWALLVASGAGLVGFGAMFWLERQIDLDLQALEQIAVDPPQ